MADNVAAPATDKVFATDEIASVHYPRNKIGFGLDGAYADVSADNPFPVAIVSGGGTGGGGGDASAANQATEIARLTSILSSVDGVEGLLTTLNSLVGGTLTVALPTGAATNAGIASALTAQTYYPATQPVSGTVSVSGTVPVSGTFFQAIQPVSGTVGITGTVPVSGTFYQATQPVSIAAPVAVTGTFFQATQPISAASLPLPAGAATQATLAALLAVGTETYTLASNITLAAGAAGPTVTVPRGGYFFFDAFFTGSSPSVKLQRLGSDGTTWTDVVTRTAVGTGDPVGIPNGSQLRLYNASAGSLTSVSAVLA